MSSFGVSIIAIAASVAVGTTVAFASRDGLLGLRWAAIAAGIGAISTAYAYCRQRAHSSNDSPLVFRYLFALSDTLLILAIGIVPAAIASRWYFNVWPWDHGPNMTISRWLAADEMWPTERLAFWLLTCWAMVFFGFAFFYTLKATLQAQAFRVALIVAKLVWLAFIVGIATYARAYNTSEVTKMLLMSVMVSGGLVLFWAAPRWFQTE